MTAETDRSAALLSLAQWLSPAFPTGGFAYSHGLEHAIARGEVATASGLECWLAALLRAGSGRSDAVLLASTLRGADPHEMDALARALAAGPERLTETLEQGRAFLAVTNALLVTGWRDLTLPVAVGLQARQLGLPVPTVLGFYLQNFVTGLTLGAVRLIPLGQTDGQRVIAALAPLIAVLALELAKAGPEALATAAIGADLAAMAHEAQEVRLFRS